MDDLHLEGDLSSGFLYVATPPRLARASLSQVPHAGFTFIDIGSGLGRMVLVAAELPFQRVIGVEFAVEMHERAVVNLEKLSEKRTRCSEVELVLGDAARFRFPSQPMVVFFNNPFGEVVMESVLANLSDSYFEQPRPIYVVYQQLVVEDPEHATGNLDLIEGCSFLHAENEKALYTGLDQFLLEPFQVRIFRTQETDAVSDSTR